MRVVVQRVSEAKVEIEGRVNGAIKNGYMLLVGFKEGDDLDIVRKMADKVVNLRIFDDENGKMNYSLLKVNGSILSISQFTLYGNAKEGRRPSFVEALNPVEATKLYDLFNEELRKFNVTVETGIFQSEMKVSLVNEGPVTIILDSDQIFVKK
ncbi:MAG: D-aminoacyl-tRNA deacylase [Bacilli bacterium]|nr:D-aminoacyl-tRNA deacylase [Bacilli bacterium]